LKVGENALVEAENGDLLMNLRELERRRQVNGIQCAHGFDGKGLRRLRPDLGRHLHQVPPGDRPCEDSPEAKGVRGGDSALVFGAEDPPARLDQGQDGGDDLVRRIDEGARPQGTLFSQQPSEDGGCLRIEDSHLPRSASRSLRAFPAGSYTGDTGSFLFLPSAVLVFPVATHSM
jgi:hypothetical protein